MTSSKPFHIEPHSVPLPPKDADVLTTACDYCIAACGYKVYRWPVGTEGHPTADGNAYGVDFPLPPGSNHWVSPQMHNVVSFKGQQHHVIVKPDADSEVVNLRGDHSIRGGALAKKCFNPGTMTGDRLQYPLLRVNGELVRISWDDAADIFADLSHEAIDTYGVHSWAIKMFGYHYLENRYALTKLAWRSIETPASAWHDSATINASTPGFKDAGIDNFGPSYQDWYEAECLVISGTDPFETKTMIWNEWILRGARDHGQKQIFINPRKTTGAAWAEANGGLWLGLLPGTDTILQMAIARVILENGWEDREWIDQYTNNKWETDSGFGQGTRNTPWQWRTTWGTFETKGFDDWKAWILSQDESELGYAARVCGLDPADIVRAAEMMAKPKEDGTRPKTSIGIEKGNYWSNNYLNTASIASLAFCCGIGNRDGQVIGRFGGHQRAGIKAGKYPKNRSPEKFAGRRRKPLDLDRWTVAGKVRFAYVVGCTWTAGMCGTESLTDKLIELTRGNEHQVTSTDVAHVVEVLGKRMASGGTVVVNQDVYMRKPIGDTIADLILPASGWGEQDLVRGNGERRLRLYSKFYDPPGEAKADWEIVQLVAQRMGFPGYDWADSNEIFEESARFSRGGRLDYKPLVEMAQRKGMRAHDLLASYGTTGIQGPTRIEGGELVGTRRLHDPKLPVPEDGPEGVNVWTKKHRAFGTHTGKGNFLKSPWWLFADFFDWLSPKDDELWVVNCRINEVWQSGFDDMERRPYVIQRFPVNFIEINPEDAERLGIESGDNVEVRCDRVPVQTGGFVGRDTKDLLFSKLMEDGHIDLDSVSVPAVAMVMDVPRPGVAAIYFLDPNAPANSLVPRVTDPISDNYRYKLGIGRIVKVGESEFKDSFAQMTFKSRAIV